MSFAAVEGYDEAIEGWGCEDDDLYHRLTLAGCLLGTFPGELLTALPHDDSERVEHYAIKSRWLSQRINSLYLHIKYDLRRQTRNGGSNVSGSIQSRAMQAPPRQRCPGKRRPRLPPRTRP